MKSLLKEMQQKFKVLEQDQDRDGDKDFADVMIARMMKSGMSREDAIKKVKDKKYNEAIVISKTADPVAVRKAQELAKDTEQDLKVEIGGATRDEEDEFHTKLDKLVHKTFGKSSDEKNVNDVDEASTSAGAGSYNTPNAFSTPSQFRKKKKMKYSGVAEAMDKKYEALIESYKQYALGDAKITPDKRVKSTIKEVSKKLQEIEQLVNYSSRLKTESGLSRDGYGPAVNNALTKISERLIKISERVRSLGE
jgi:hypothetical protein